MLDLEGNVVYTAYKGTELGSNIKVGEFRGGGWNPSSTRP